MSQTCHCPFLNRSDQRCSEVFNLDHLQHAFKYCFDRYSACPVYAEQLSERQYRRQGVVSHAPQVYVDLTVRSSRPAHAGDAPARLRAARYAQPQHAIA